MTVKCKYSKEFYEHYAKICMETVYNEKYSLLDKGESPDWQSGILDIGVEVTQAISSQKVYTEAVMSTYFGKGYAGEFIVNEIEEKNGDIRGQVSNYDGVEVYSSFVDLSYSQIKKAYLGKTAKLNKHYTKYSFNQLFVYSYKVMNKQDVYECFNINISKFETNFDICFINCIEKMFVCDFRKKKILDIIYISSDQLKYIKEKALEISEFEF